MWWIGIHAPALSLEAFSAPWGTAAAVQPLALVAQHRIVAANAAALALGVTPGLKRATALALAPALLLGSADAARDAQALRALAHALLAFTQAVTLLPPQGVLAEVRASVRCFGGPQRLWQRVHEALAPLGHQLQWAHAPTALGALLLARAGDDATTPQRVPGPADLARLHQQLDPLPLGLLSLPAAQAEVLQAMGLSTLGELRRQPRAGLARRLGPELLDLLDRAHGDAPDPRPAITAPARFHSRLELHAHTDHSDVLLEAAGVLLARQAAWARALQARVAHFTLTFHHETRLRASSLGEAGVHRSLLDIRLAEASADPAHWRAVLRERLAREPLAAPVLALALSCDEPVIGPPPEGQLFPDGASQHEGLLRLLERLQARLGPEAVQRLGQQDEHRPERASVSTPAATATSTAPRPARASVRRTSHAPTPASASASASAARAAEPPRLTRPVWLLAEPQALAERQGRPWLASQPLRLLQGPERIEAGWWDGGLAARDYFIAEQPDGALLWVYRLRPAPAAGEPGWFLHGRFG